MESILESEKMILLDLKNEQSRLVLETVKQKGWKLTQSAEAFPPTETQRMCVGDTHQMPARSSTSFFFLYLRRVRYILYLPSTTLPPTKTCVAIYVVRSSNEQILSIPTFHTKKDSFRDGNDQLPFVPCIRIQTLSKGSSISVYFK